MAGGWPPQVTSGHPAADDEQAARVQRLSSDDRLLGRTLIGRPAVTAVELTRAGLQVRTSDYGAFCRDIAVLARDHGIRLREVLPTDESLESVFAYLVANDASSSAPRT